MTICLLATLSGNGMYNLFTSLRLAASSISWGLSWQRNKKMKYHITLTDLLVAPVYMCVWEGERENAVKVSAVLPKLLGHVIDDTC